MPGGRSPVKKHLLEGQGHFLRKQLHSVELAIRAAAPAGLMRRSCSRMTRSWDA